MRMNEGCVLLRYLLGVRMHALAGYFYSGYKAEADKGEEHGPSCLVAACPCDLFHGFYVAPRPYLHEGAYYESGEDDEGFLVPACEEPVEELGKAEDADCCSDAEDSDDEEVAAEVHSGDEVCDDSHYVLVLSEDEEDEASGYSREDHCADRDGSAEEDEPECVRSLGRGERAYDDAEYDSEGKEQGFTQFPT